jgi:2-methylcitrate dehydratase PrpD
VSTGAAAGSTAERLAAWAVAYEPTEADLRLARRSLVDTVAVALAAREDPVAPLFGALGVAGSWAAFAHVLDFDDLHMGSTTHVSAVCVPVALAAGGDARAYLAGAGVMARLGVALGWPHYGRGWHATCTAGAPAAAVTAAIAAGADVDAVAAAIALAVPAAGGVQRAFGTAAKSLQVGFAADAGVRAARLAAAGASADPAALDQWLALVGGDARRLEAGGPAMPGGLAVKLFPCCYALQRPMSAARVLRDRGVSPRDVERIVVRTPEPALQPLIHHRPRTGLEGKFSLEYGVACALLDEHPGFASFTDEAVRRPAARDLVARIALEATPGGDGLLVGTASIEADIGGASVERVELDLPPGAPGRPLSDEQLHTKVGDCVGGAVDDVMSLDWEEAAQWVDERLRGKLLHWSGCRPSSGRAVPTA